MLDTTCSTASQALDDRDMVTWHLCPAESFHHGVIMAWRSAANNGHWDPQRFNHRASKRLKLRNNTTDQALRWFYRKRARMSNLAGSTQEGCSVRRLRM